MRTFAIVNQKGGCGKTTSAINLAAVFASRGRRTLVVDLDPQAHCAAGLGVPEDAVTWSMADALLAQTADDVRAEKLFWEVARDLILAPSTTRLAALEAPGGGLHQLQDKDRRLEKFLALVAPDFDVCFIDCPPTISLLTFNAMRAAREVIVPVETGYFALKGARKQWETLSRVMERIGRPIVRRLLPTLHDTESRIARDILGALQKEFADALIPIAIRRDDALREAASMGQPITKYSPDAPAGRDYAEVADYLDAHERTPPVEIELVTRAPGAAPSPALRPPARPHHAAAIGGHIPGMSPASPSRQPTTDSTPAEANGVLGGRAQELAGRLRTLASRTGANGVPSHAPAAEPGPPGFSSGRHEQHGNASDRPTTAPAVRPSPVPTQSQVAVPMPTAAAPVAAAAPETTPGAAQTHQLSHILGVTQTAQGVMFVQPIAAGTNICVAGDFNGWSAHSHPLTPRPELGVHQGIARLTPGTHRYRLVVDGVWMSDPYGPDHGVDAAGESLSVLNVESRTPAHAMSHASPGSDLKPRDRQSGQ